MSWFKIIQLIMKLAPTLIGIIKSIIDAIGSISNPSAKELAVDELKKAVLDVKERGDLGSLDRVTDHLGIRDRLRLKREAKQVIREKIRAEF